MPRKKRKRGASDDTEIDFKEVKQRLDLRTKTDNGHVVWQGPKVGTGPGTFDVQGIRHLAHQWYYLLENQLTAMPENSMLEKQCDVDLCIVHYELCSLHLTSVLDMNEYDHVKACQRVDDNTVRRGDCLIWTGPLYDGGYGRMELFGKTIGAHKAVYMLANFVDVPDGLLVRHKQDCKGDTACVNPDHLELGTHEQNMQDKARDGTQTQGEAHPTAKLTDADVKQIINDLLQGTKTREQIANDHDVAATTIGDIKTGKTWSHLITEEQKRQLAELATKSVHAAKLDMKTVYLLKSDRVAGMSTDARAAKHGVPIETIKRIDAGKAYGSVDISRSLDELAAEKKRKYYQKKQKDILKKSTIVPDINFKEPHWIWQGKCLPTGHPTQMRFHGRLISVLQVSWMSFNETDTFPDENARHKCRFPACVQPDHLEPGTIGQNARDRIRDGTQPRGSMHPQAKLTENDVRQIRAARGIETAEARAKRFDISLPVIYKIDSGKSWTHVV